MSLCKYKRSWKHTGLAIGHYYRGSQKISSPSNKKAWKTHLALVDPGSVTAAAKLQTQYIYYSNQGRKLLTLDNTASKAKFVPRNAYQQNFYFHVYW